MDLLLSSSISETGLDISPTMADMAIVSVDAAGTLGDLNQSVLNAYGYSIASIKGLSFMKGYDLLHASGRKPILFVVTVTSGETASNLEKNLYFALENNISFIRGKSIWLPLMGTGSGGLGFEKSYNITVQVLSRFSNLHPEQAVQFVLSIPATSEGVSLLNQINYTKDLQNFSKEESSYDKSSIEELLKHSNCKFFLAKTPESGKGFTDKFLKEGVWEAAKDQHYADLLTSINVHDVIILYSTGKRNAQYFRIMAVGRVSHNPKDGRRLSVDWQIPLEGFNIDANQSFKGGIAPLEIDFLVKIFSRIDRNLWEPLLVPPRFPRLAGLISDTDAGEDHLNITRDVMAFARVMAAKSFYPPLAIALLGKWGSGKSFFMRKLREQIDLLSQHDPHQTYCQGIVHIHFNAWSYTDANLWASLVTKIFEGLNTYISENTVSDKEKQRVEQQLTNKLTIAKEEVAALENQKNSVTEQINFLNIRKKQLRNSLKDNIQHIQKRSVWDAITFADEEFNAKEQIIKELQDNPSFNASTEQLIPLLPETYWKNPAQAYAEVSSNKTFLREFFWGGGNVIKNLVWLALILALISTLPILLIHLRDKLSQVDFTIPQIGLALLTTAGAMWKRAESTYKRLQPVVASFWRIKEDYEKKKQEAISKFDQEEKAIHLRIDREKAELVVITQQLQQAHTLKADLQYKINHALATEALYSFIEKRSNSEDYKKHLGIVSTIRKDFEILNGLFSGHVEEAEKQREAEEFRKNFRKPLERIILYIDDLDRCQEENVVQVLEAVNLLMAYPLFVVVVGVDPRWVKNALMKKYHLQFSKPSHEGTLKGLEEIESSNYLEKIFQIPFHLKLASDESVKDMLQKLAQAKPIRTDVTNSHEKITLPVIPTSGTPSSPTYKKLGLEPNNSVVPGATEGKPTRFPNYRPEALLITDKEIGFMQDLSFIIGDNPRAIKRFVNIYRIIKAHEDFTSDATFENREVLVILFLLALPIGKYKQLSPSFEEYIMQEENKGKTFYAFTDTINNIEELTDDKTEDLDEIKQDLHSKLSDKVDYKTLQQTPISTFYQHNQLVKRFSFKNL